MRKFLLGALLLAAGGIYGAEFRSVDAVPASGTIKLDGKIVEPAWDKAVWQENFTTKDKSPAKETTRFKVLAGENGLYFAFEAIDSVVKSVEKEHDGALWTDDCIELFIMPEPQPADDPNIREYKQFMFNPGGARFERALRATVGDPAWNVPWKVATVRTSQGFNAEVFIPYYALAPFSGARTWRFNVCRENRGTPQAELSSWNPSTNFMDTERYGILKNIPVDLSEYQVAFFSSAGRMQSVNGKIVPVFDGLLSGKDKINYTVQMSARTPDGKLAAFNSMTGTPMQGKVNISIPMEITESGKYILRSSVITPGGKTAAYEEKNITVTIAPFAAKLIKPCYRNNIYLAMPDPELLVSVTQFAPAAEYAKASLSVTVTDAAGKTVAEKKIKSPAKTEKIKFDAAKFKPGAYQVKTALTGASRNNGDFVLDFNVIPEHTKGNLITLDSERRILLNGKPFLPRGFYGFSALPALGKSGFNILIHSYLNRFDVKRILERLDEAHKHGLMLAFPPRYKIGGDFFGFVENGKKVRTLSADAYKKIEYMVNAVKHHPAFFGWMLYDEPRGAEMTAELKRQYEFLRKIDPDHPVLGGDNTAGSCIDKQGHCDIHVLDMYYRPLFGGKYTHTVASLFNAVENIYNAAPNEAIIYMPQAFNNISFYPSGRFPSPSYAESRAMTFGSIVVGASGVIPYKIGNDSLKYFEQNSNSGIFYSPGMKVGWLDGIGPEVKNLSPVLLAEKIPVKCSSPKMRVGGRKYNGKYFVIAVNPEPGEIKAEISWPDRRVKDVRVLGEKRSVPLKKGKLTETFTAFAVHIYTDDGKYPEGVDIAAVNAKIEAELKAALKK